MSMFEHDLILEELREAEQELEILNKENKRLCAQNAKQAAEIKRLREALDGMLDWALSNRGTKYEFVTCRSGAKAQDYPVLESAIAILKDTADD